MKKRIFATACLPLIALSCDSPVGNEEGTVAIRFATSPAARASAGSTSGASDELTLTGTNGTLRIEDIRFVVAELELEGSIGSCGSGDDDDDDRDDDCEEFETGPFLVDLPLGTGAVTLTADEIPAGTYRKLEFEIESLDDDEDDDAVERARSQNILAQVRSVYPNFPRTASMVVKGTFTPAGGSPQPFVVYFDAEVEIELDLVPPVTIPGATALTVNVHPELWFKRGTQVVNLAALNGRLVEFELEIENGFHEVEIDD